VLLERGGVPRNPLTGEIGLHKYTKIQKLEKAVQTGRISADRQMQQQRISPEKKNAVINHADKKGLEGGTRALWTRGYSGKRVM